MKKTLLLFVTISCTNFGISQNNGIVTYKKENLKQFSKHEKFQKMKKERPEFYKTVSLIFENMEIILQDLEFDLKFNNNESFFKDKEFLELETNKFYGAALGPEGDAEYYTNIKENKHLEYRETFGEKFIISNPKIKWELTSESKKVGKYLCYKATTTKINRSSTGKISEATIEAWYCPELNIPFRPIGYGGLPGLIIELTYLNSKFYVHEINLNPSKEIIIKEPSKGKRVTQEEMSQMYKDAMSSFKEGF